MVAQKHIEHLSQNLSGALLQDGAPGYEHAITIDNGRIHLKPGFIVIPASAADISLALEFARDHGVKFTVRGGGHSAAGYCLNQGGMVIDMSGLKARSLDARTGILRAETGNTWRELYQYLQQTGTGYIPIGGGCPTVGIPGFMLGGGISFVSRSYGLSIDNLISIDIITPDGKLRHLSDESSTREERDLFWACRGGAGGNFGIAVAFEMRLHKPRTAKMLTGYMYYPLEAAQDVLGLYNEWIETVPDALSIYGYLGNTANPVYPSQTQKSLGLTAIWNGDSAEGMRLLAPLLRFKTISVKLYDLTLPDFEELNGSITLVDKRQAYIRSGMMAPRSMTPEVVSIFSEYMTHAPSPSSFMIWDHCGGKVSEVDPTATAYWHRGARFLYEMKSIWQADSAMGENVDWAYRFGEALSPHTTGAYVNYIDPLLVGWQKQYYGENYPRLLEIKKHWDPAGFFRFQQSIGSTFEPTPGDASPLFRTFAP